jgi:hypothetical protein
MFFNDDPLTHNMHITSDGKNYFTVNGGRSDDGQATPALSPNGKLLYIMDNGDIRVYNFKKGTLEKIMSGFNHGGEFQTGASAVAVDDKYIYTWDSVSKNIYVYSLKGKYIQTVPIRDGEYGFSLSCANGLIFVSTDGNYNTGRWYGYALMNK